MEHKREIYYNTREYPEFASKIMRDQSNSIRKQDAIARVSRAMRESWHVCKCKY